MTREEILSIEKYWAEQECGKEDEIKKFNIQHIAEITSSSVTEIIYTIVK